MALRLQLALLLCATSIVSAALSSPILQVINCSTSGNFTATGAYAGNVKQLLSSLPENAISKNGGFYNGTIGDGEGTVYGLGMCPADYSRADCGDCLVAAAGLPSRCPGSATVLAMFDRCLVRYSDVYFFGTPEIGVVEALGGDMVRTTATYGQTVAQSLKDRTDEAVLSPRRFAVSSGAPYVLVQCTWDLPADECRRCLTVLSANATDLFAIRTEGQRKSFSCTVRYSNTSYMVVPFVDAPAASGPAPPGSGDQTAGSSPTDHPSSVRGEPNTNLYSESIYSFISKRRMHRLIHAHKHGCI